MNQALQSRASVARQRQQGVSLLVVLLLLIVMSILGIAVLRSSAMQERMSANMVDRNEAMQAAETGLLIAQTSVIRGTFNPMWDGGQTYTSLRTAAGKTCSANGYCDRSNPANAATWQTASPPASAAYVTLPTGKGSYAFTVEYLGKAQGASEETRGACETSNVPRYQCERPMFRVTSYGRGRGVSTVVLQANVVSQAR